MAGLEGGGPPQPRRHPEEHTSTRGGGPSVSYLPPPQHQTEGDAPSPRGCSPPQPGLYIQWFSAVLWLRGHGGGGDPPVSGSQLDSGSDLGLSVRPGTHSCALCLPEGWYTTLQKPRPTRNIPLKSETKNWLISCRLRRTSVPVSYVALARSPLLGPRAVPGVLT